MTIALEPEKRSSVAETVQRRWHLAIVVGLAVLLVLTVFDIVLTLQSARANHLAVVLKATKDIFAGHIISDDELGDTYVRVDDSAVLANLINAGQRRKLVGQVATENVRAGGLLPAGLGAPQSSASKWEVPLTVRRMPPDLRRGDQVALVASGTAKTGESIDFVVARDVTVLHVGRESVSLWLPAADAAQIEWYADHGGLVLARMRRGTAQQVLPAGDQTS